jgi:hypothetical protein
VLMYGCVWVHGKLKKQLLVDGKQVVCARCGLQGSPESATPAHMSAGTGTSVSTGDACTTTCM